MENIDIEIMEIMSESEKIKNREIMDEIDKTTAINKLLNDLRIRVEQEIEKKENIENEHKIFTNNLLNDLKIRVEQEIDKKEKFDNNHKIFTDKSTQTT